MIKNPIFLIMILLFLAEACVHEPFPGPPPGMGNDTINNPVDTSTADLCHPDTVYYYRDIQPLLTGNCAKSGCHDDATQQKGVLLNNYDNVMATADVRPGDPEGSDLYEMITEPDNDDRMPPFPNPRLSQAQIDLIRKWIMQGAQNLSCDDCDTTALTYTNGIKNIFDQNCISCHGGVSPQANMRLETYTQVKDALLSPKDLLIRINGGNADNAAMPQGGKLTDCNVRKIEIWFNNGMPL